MRKTWLILFAKRERIVEANAANVASINLAYVGDYLNFLKQEGKSYLSKQFIQNEEKYWQAALKLCFSGFTLKTIKAFSYFL
ncbi:MAG: hypothetical protein HC831_28580 [Chloroflexia bacterium]|nr:hypothetical protein [Chloroflexia bacterium]